MMLRGIRGLGDYQAKATDMCLNFDTHQPQPCGGPTDDLLCVDQGFQGKCSTQSPFTRKLMPIMTVQEALAYCNNQVGCQIINAAPCDPVFVAAGFQQCSQQGLLSYYNLGQQNLTGPNQYNAPVTASTAGGLTYQDAQWLAAQGIINPVSSPTQTIVPTFNPINPTAISTPPPTSTQWGSSLEQTVPVTISQPTYSPITYPTTIPTQPVANPIGPAPSATVLPSLQPLATAGSIPGSNTAAQQQTGGSQAAPSTTTDSTGGTLLPGVPNNTLYLAGGAILLLLLLKK